MMMLTPGPRFGPVAQFDVDGLLTLLGGRQELTRRLDAFFELTPDGDFMNPEGPGFYREASPAHWHVPWLYTLSNQPQRGQCLSGILFQEVPESKITPPRAAWELFTLLGLYPVIPSRGQYMLGSPQVASARLDVGGSNIVY